jgi:hypothetical protein
MNLNAMKILILTEARLRLRRISTLVTLFAVMAFGWWMFADQSSGYAFLVVGDARVLNTSPTIALASASLFSMIFGLAGFFLTRGRIGEDVRCGTGSVIASTSISNVQFLICRWLGGVAYLTVMATVFMLTMMVCHFFRGTGSIHLWVYIETYLVILFPLMCFCVSCSVLFDSIAPLMGKVGDVLFFFLWTFQFSAMTRIDEHAPIHFNGLMLIDFTGVVMTIKSLDEHFHTTGISLGYATFNTALPALTLSDDLWSAPMVLMRLVSTAIACLIVLPAFFVFHRYSTDKVKVRHASKRRSPIVLLNQLTRPLSRLVQPLFGLAAGLPGIVGGALADVALTLTAAPVAILALIVFPALAMIAPFASLPAILLAAVVFWGVIVCEVSTMDFTSGCEDLTGAVGGGRFQRYVRQFAATFLLGIFFTGVILLRFAFHHPVLAGALLAGLLSLSALSSLLGRTSRTPKLFLSLFLFWSYVAVQVPNEPLIDIAGFNGVANVETILIQTGVAIIALISGYCYNRWAK